MSDEQHLEAARRHADGGVCLQWQPLQPDEALMALEEGASYASMSGRAELQESLMCYLFGGGNPECWQDVALRGLAVIRHCVPSLLVGRSLREVEALREYVTAQGFGGLGELLEAAQDEEGAEVLRRLMEYFFPGQRRRWLLEGAQRVYLVARAFQPHLVTVYGREMSYEDLARIFEGGKLSTPRARGQARSRWSARAQRVLRMPIEEAGGVVRLQFGKAASTREKYRAAAKGNAHRKGKYKGEKD